MSKKKTTLDAVKASTQVCVRFAEPIATIDIETLGFGLNAVVTEVSIIVVQDVALQRRSDHPDTEVWRPADEYADVGVKLTIDFSVAHQILEKGRTVEPDTVEWWTKELKAWPGMPTLSQHFNGTIPADNVSYSEICLFLDRASHIWVNHPEFDLARLESLFGHPIWRKHKNVLDVSYLRKQMKALDDRPNKEQEYGNASFVKHDSLHDCAWNLHQVAHGARLFQEANIPWLMPGPAFTLVPLYCGSN